jgi:hypothetical protein
MNTGASRQSATLVCDDLIKLHGQKAHRVSLLKEWLAKNPPPLEVEELLWSFLISSRGGFYS